MKIGQIKKLMMEEKGGVLLESQTKTQWIGGKDWLTQVDHNIRISPDSLRGLFDISEEQADKLKIETGALESHPLWPVMKRNANVMKPIDMDIGNYGGVVVLTLGNAVYLAERKYIRAFVSREDYRQYLLMWDEGNRPLIVVEDGYLFAGIMRPMPTELCALLMRQMGELAALTPSGNRPPDQGPLKLDAENGIQLDMDDMRVEPEDNDDGDT